MSLINQILGQQVVPLTVGLAVLMLFTAIILAMVPRVKASRVRRAKAKAQRLAAEAERAAANMTDDAEEDELAARARAKAQATGDEVAEGGKPKKGGDKSSKEDKSPKTKKPGIPGSVPPAAGEGKAPPAIATKPPIPTGPPASAPGAAKAEEKKDEPTPEMLDLLSSVFSEEESAERQAKLMKGMENVEIDHLMTLCNTVLGQIRGEAPSIVVKIKENQLQ